MQRMSNNDKNQDKSDRHPLYTDLWRFDFLQHYLNKNRIPGSPAGQAVY